MIRGAPSSFPVHSTSILPTEQPGVCLGIDCIIVDFVSFYRTKKAAVVAASLALLAKT